MLEHLCACALQGKTESTKYLLRYLTVNYGEQAGVIEQRIIECMPPPVYNYSVHVQTIRSIRVYKEIQGLYVYECE